MLRRVVILAVLGCVFACAATAAPANWAAPQITAVTNAGILGTSASAFKPQSPLTQAQLADAIAKTDAFQHSPAPPTPPVELATNVGPDAVVAGFVSVQLDVTGPDIDHVAFAVDGTGVVTTYESPYSLELDTTTLADGIHALAVNVAFANGGYAIATWQVTVANAPGAVLTPTDTPVPLAIAKSRLPALPAPPARTLYRTVAPTATVSVKKLDAVLVGYLDLGGAARKIQSTLAGAGLNPPANTGTEAVARMLGLRLNHPAADDGLELRPLQAVTRAEAAYSFARLLTLDDAAVQAVQAATDAFTLPELTPWQQRILTSAIHYVGYPYIWGGTSPGPETLFGVKSGGGFDCSGFVWRVYKLTPYAGEGTLASVLEGRTTYQMSGEVGRAKRIGAANLQPADVMFFGANGPRSKPGVVDHTGLYLGNGWFVQSSGEGVTLLPFDGWYTRTFAWARRPLREAGLSG
ncbi:MAG TPA: NlpC/P60 family protein [Gaiellaceae bacterium]|nr:NlpC/P60 family protein [Gaiellaceae bacterium]